MFEEEYIKKELAPAEEYADALETHELLLDYMNLTDNQRIILRSSYKDLEELHAKMLLNEK